MQSLTKLKAEQFSRYFLLFVLIGTAVVFFTMVKMFLVSVMMAAVFAGLFYPLYGWLLKVSRNQEGLSAFVCCLVLLLGLLIPIYIVADLVSSEAIEFYHTGEQKVREIIEKGDAGLIGKVKNYTWVKRLNLDKIDWQSSLQEITKTAAKLLATVINKASKGTFQLLANLFLTFFAMYYFFRDGNRLLHRLKYLSPLADKYKDELVSRFISVARATIKGTLLIGLIKGVLGGLTFWFFGISSPVLWGVVMVILSIIPMVGGWLVMYPAAIIQVLMGHLWQGIAIFLITVIVISSIDNVLGPRLVARDSGLHALLIFFSTLGGISMFGVMGFIVGPIITALFLSILDVYSIEFKPQLDLAHGIGAQADQGQVPDAPRD